MTAPPPGEGAVVGEAAGRPWRWELGVGAPASRAAGRRGVAPVLVSVHSAWFFRVEHTVKGNIVFITFFHSVYFFSWDSVNVSSTWGEKCKRLVRAVYPGELLVLYKS